MYKKNKTPGPSGVYPRTIRLTQYSKSKKHTRLVVAKRKHHMAISINAERVFDKIHHPLRRKNRNFLKLIKGIY